jgi:alcohol dehydrogenase class IV
MLPSQMLFPGRTVAADDAILQLGNEARAFGMRGLLVHGRSLATSGKLAAILQAAPAGMTMACHAHGGGEPTTDEAEQLRAKLREQRVDWVAAVGGGSVLDLAKAAAGLCHAPGSVAAYHNGSQPIPPATLPLLAAPTTAGTGSEATIVSVLTNPDGNLKLGFRHPSFMPRLVILDPLLLRSCPPSTLAAAGMDALVQAFEAYTSRYATPFTRVLAELALVRIAQALPAVYDGDWSRAPDLLQGSYLGGLSLSHARLGVVHGLAHPLGARWHVAHGVVCAVCFPAALAFNRPVLGDDLAHLRGLLGRDIGEVMQDLTVRMKLVSPFRGATISDREAIIHEILISGSTDANPRKVTAREAGELLDAIFG